MTQCPHSYYQVEDIYYCSRPKGHKGDHTYSLAWTTIQSKSSKKDVGEY